MDVKTCGFLSHIPTRFKFGWDEEDPLCIDLKQVILQQIQRLRQTGYSSFYIVPDSGAGLWTGEILNLLCHDDPSLLFQCLLPHEETATKWSPELRARYFALLEPFLGEIKALFQDTRADYDAGIGTDFQAGLKASMEHESAAILHLIFDHYEDAMLLLCRSAGSSLEHYFDGIVQSKIQESVAFFRRAGFTGIDETLLGLLISAQFDSYRRIVTECSDRETAEGYMESLMTYHFGGWVEFSILLSNYRRVCAMKYNGFCFWMFKGPMKKLLADGGEYCDYFITGDKE